MDIDTDRKRIQNMNTYFKSYINYINNHHYVVCVEKISDIKDSNQDSIYNKYNIRSYYQCIRIELSSDAPEDYSKIEQRLRRDVSTIMRPKNYKNGSTLINIQPEPENESRTCKAKIYYAPEVPVYDFQVNDEI